MKTKDGFGILEIKKPIDREEINRISVEMTVNDGKKLVVKTKLFDARNERIQMMLIDQSTSYQYIGIIIA